MLMLLNPLESDWFSPFYIELRHFSAFKHIINGYHFSEYPDDAAALSQQRVSPAANDYSEWRHLAVSFEAASGRISSYIDGELVDEAISEKLRGLD
eukprot:5857015-Pleurochrysis_carterae.AAC.1